MPSPLSDDEFFGPSGFGGPLKDQTKFVIRERRQPDDVEEMLPANPDVVIRGQPGQRHEIVLVGGPCDDMHLAFNGRPRPLIALEDRPQGCAEIQERKKAHFYRDRGDGRHYDYQYVKSLDDLNAQEVDDDDEWDGDELVEA